MSEMNIKSQTSSYGVEIVSHYHGTVYIYSHRHDQACHLCNLSDDQSAGYVNTSQPTGAASWQDLRPRDPAAAQDPLDQVAFDAMMRRYERVMSTQVYNWPARTGVPTIDNPVQSGYALSSLMSSARARVQNG